VPLAQHDEVIEAITADSPYIGPVSASLSVGKRMQVPGSPVTPLGWEPSASPWRRARGKSTAPFPPAERGLLPPYDAVPPNRLRFVVVQGRTPHVLCRHPPPSTLFPRSVADKRPYPQSPLSPECFCGLSPSLGFPVGAPQAGGAARPRLRCIPSSFSLAEADLKLRRPERHFSPHAPGADSAQFPARTNSRS
jgi:hypothetical protein